jgi:HdeA/HdeB family
MKLIQSAVLALCFGFCPAALAQQQSPAPPAAAPITPSPAAPNAPPGASSTVAPTAPLPAPAAPPAAPQAAQPPSAPAAPAASAARIAPHKWDVDRVLCSDLLRASDDDRASAAMFYYGYLAAKAGIHVIDVSRISGNISKVMQQCRVRPGLTVPQAFREALGRRRVR